MGIPSKMYGPYGLDFCNVNQGNIKEIVKRKRNEPYNFSKRFLDMIGSFKNLESNKSV